MPEIAKLDSAFTLIAVEDVSCDDWVTDKDRLTVQLPDCNDMRLKLGQYYYDFGISSFMPHIADESNFDKVIDALADAIFCIAEQTNTLLDGDTADVIKHWRKLAK